MYKEQLMSVYILHTYGRRNRMRQLKAIDQ